MTRLEQQRKDIVISLRELIASQLEMSDTQRAQALTLRTNIINTATNIASNTKRADVVASVTVARYVAQEYDENDSSNEATAARYVALVFALAYDAHENMSVAVEQRDKSLEESLRELVEQAMRERELAFYLA